jgi:hypothetical protein
MTCSLFLLLLLLHDPVLLLLLLTAAHGPGQAWTALEGGNKAHEALFPSRPLEGLMPGTPVLPSVMILRSMFFCVLQHRVCVLCCCVLRPPGTVRRLISAASLAPWLPPPTACWTHQSRTRTGCSQQTRWALLACSLATSASLGGGVVDSLAVHLTAVGVHQHV